MDYNILLQEIKKRGFKRILVTGAHRSGTTFAATAIAHDLGLLFYPEENIRGGSLVLLKDFQKTHKEYVMQAPGLSVNCHLVDFDIVIMMHRNLADIIDSMRKLNDRVIQFELERIETMFGEKYVKLGLPLAKLAIFNEIQKPLINNSAILDYESLSNHPLWIPEAERKDWHIRQTWNK